MAGEYETIVFADMRDLLVPLKFEVIDLRIDNVQEIVFARSLKIPNVEWGELDYVPISLRVYTSIDIRLGLSRSSGKDAIRVMSFVRMRNGSISPLHGSGRVNRVPGWRERLTERINTFLGEKFWARCKKCNLPMREIKMRGGESFLGCIGYPDCRSTRPLNNK